MSANPYRIRTKSGDTVTATALKGKVWLSVSDPLAVSGIELDENDVIRLAGWLTKWYTDQEDAKKASRRPRKAKKND